MHALVRSSLAALVLAACTPGTVNSDDRAILSLAGPAEIVLAPGASVELDWLVVRQSSGPRPGHSVVFAIVAAGDHGCTLASPSAVTGADGLAGTTFTAGGSPLATPVQVRGAVSDIPITESQPQPASFTIRVEEPLRALRPEPPDRTRYAGSTGGRVSLAVRATTGGARALPGETVEWSVLEGGGGGAHLGEPTSRTDLTGIARAALACGSTPGTVTVQAAMEGTAPVVFTVDVADFGTCDDTHPCPAGWDCVGGFCIEPTPECTTDEECGSGRRCRFGRCVTSTPDGAPCKLDEECGEGETCVFGMCTPCEGMACPCASIEDCPDGFICVDGVCVCPPGSPDCGGDPTCEVVDPDLAGFWDVDSTLRIRESLPDWIDDTLDFLGPPFRFLSDGMLGGFDFDIPIIGDALSDAADSLVRRYVPRWVGELLAAIADLNDILSTLHVDQEMTLWGAGLRDQYAGTFEWREVEMVWRGESVRGRVEDITGLRVDHDRIEAQAICGTFYLHRHDVSIAFGTIVRWVLDVVVTAATEGEYFSLEDLLLDLTSYCDDIAMAIDDLAWDLADALDISLPDVYGIVLRSCEAGIESGTASAIRWLEGISVSEDAMSIGGRARIAGPTLLEDGRWDGRLLGGDFTGDFTARRR